MKARCKPLTAEQEAKLMKDSAKKLGGIFVLIHPDALRHQCEWIDAAGNKTGPLCRMNGKPVKEWDPEGYARLLGKFSSIQKRSGPPAVRYLLAAIPTDYWRT